MVKLSFILAVLVLPCAISRERTLRDRFPPKPVGQPSTLPPKGLEVSTAVTLCQTSESKITTGRVVTSPLSIEPTVRTEKVVKNSTPVTKRVTTRRTTIEVVTVGKKRGSVVTSTIKTTSAVSSTERTAAPKVYRSGMSVGAIVGIALGTLLFIIALLTVSCYCYCVKRRGGYRFRAGLPGVGEFDGGFVPAVALKVSDYMADDDEILATFSVEHDADRWGGSHAVLVGADIEMK